MHNSNISNQTSRIPRPHGYSVNTRQRSNPETAALSFRIKFTREIKSEEDISCSICLGIFVKPFILECNHLFCSKCLGEWLCDHNTCPICRSTILKKPISCKWLETFIYSIKDALPLREARRMTLYRPSGLHRNDGKENPLLPHCQIPRMKLKR